jgi:hypothetical protein
MNKKVITAGTPENSANDGTRQRNLGPFSQQTRDDQQIWTDESGKLIAVLTHKKPGQSSHPAGIVNVY